MIWGLVLLGVALGLVAYAGVVRLDTLLDPVANVAMVIIALAAMPLLAVTTGQLTPALWHGAILLGVTGACLAYTPQPVFGPAIVILLYSNSMHFFDRIDALTLVQTDLVVVWRAATLAFSGGLMVSAWRGGHIH